MDRGAWWAMVHAWGCKELDMTEQLTRQQKVGLASFVEKIPFPL